MQQLTLEGTQLYEHSSTPLCRECFYSHFELNRNCKQFFSQQGVPCGACARREAGSQCASMSLSRYCHWQRFMAVKFRRFHSTWLCCLSADVVIGGFNHRQGEAFLLQIMPPQIFLTLSRFVFTVPTRKIWSVYSQDNYRNCCHVMSNFKVKKAPNSISAGAPPQTPIGEFIALSQTSSWPHPRSRPSEPRNNLPPQMCIPKSAYKCSA